MNPLQIARLYDARATVCRLDSHQDDIRNSVEIVKFVCPDTGSRILDLGCGAGHHLAALASAGYRNLHGVDISRRAIEIAQRNCLSSAVSLACGNVADFSFAGFDLVTAFNSSLGSLGGPGDRQYLSSAAGALRPGGLLLLCYINEAAASRREGTFYSRAAGRGPDYVTTKVSISTDRRWMTLRQTCQSRRLPSERIRVFADSELLAMVRSVGIERVTESEYSERLDLLSYVCAFLGRKAVNLASP